MMIRSMWYVNAFNAIVTRIATSLCLLGHTQMSVAYRGVACSDLDRHSFNHGVNS